MSPGRICCVPSRQQGLAHRRHGYAPIVARFLAERGYEAVALDTRFSGESLQATDDLQDAGDQRPA